MEVWSVIPGFPNYEISDHRRVRLISSGHILKCHTNQSNSYYVSLYKDGKQHCRSVWLLSKKVFGA